MANNVYDSRREVFVTPYTGAILKYGFLTNVTQPVGVSCGHTAVDSANPPEGLAFGVNAPKPGRASKKRVSGVDSSFYDPSVRGVLRSQGWSLTAPKTRAGSSSSASHAVYVTLGAGIKYAWRMPSHTYNKIGGERSGLGIIDATSAMNDLVWGALKPRPPRANKYIASDSNSDSITTFCDPSVADSPPSGWTIVKSAIVII
jgi:hypothetical protein